MTDIVTDPEALVSALPSVLLMVGLVVVGARVFRHMAPLVKRLSHLVDDLAGEAARPGVPARPGVMERLQELESRTTELRRNGGSSMRDALDRLDARTEGLDERLRRIESLITQPLPPVNGKD